MGRARLGLPYNQTHITKDEKQEHSPTYTAPTIGAEQSTAVPLHVHEPHDCTTWLVRPYAWRPFVPSFQ